MPLLCRWYNTSVTLECKRLSVVGTINLRESRTRVLCRSPHSSSALRCMTCVYQRIVPRGQSPTRATGGGNSLQVSSDGQVMWVRRMGPGSEGGTERGNDELTNVAVTSLQSVYASGTFSGPSSWLDSYMDETGLNRVLVKVPRECSRVCSCGVGSQVAGVSVGSACCQMLTALARGFCMSPCRVAPVGRALACFAGCPNYSPNMGRCCLGK